MSLLALAILLTTSLCACDTRNIGTKAQPDTGPVITSFTVTPEDPAGLFGDLDATFKVKWEGGTAPYSISLDFGGAALPSVESQPASSPFAVTRTLVNLAAAQSFTAVATVTDANGFGQPATLAFNVGALRGPCDGFAIDGISVVGNQVTVSGYDSDGDKVSVTLDSVTGGLVGHPERVDSESSSIDAVFTFEAGDLFAGGTGTATFTLSDEDCTDTDTSGTITVEPFYLPDDTLAAVPLIDHATVADTVKVVIATGPTANPFQFMTGVSILFPPGCKYVANSLDYGAPVPGDPGLNPAADKDQESVDGIWTTVYPASGFLGLGDNLLVPDKVIAGWPPDYSAIDFNITPLGGGDAPAGTAGLLFNFNLEFSAPGVYQLDILLFDEVNRTYYQDGSQAIYQWADISNENEHNTVTVTP
ncbi:hypothetical protein IT575_04880 [bacterium]|nr:hypothetical protein [bacterium]